MLHPAKAEACTNCERCVLSDVAPDQNLPYEIHVTVDEADVDLFKDSCARNNVKPLFLALQLAGGGAVRDVMTSSVHVGNDMSAHAEMHRIAGGLSNDGFRVTRMKIETVPWHVSAPSIANGLDCGTGQYFEAHLAIRCSQEDRDRLEIITSSLGLHLSRNVFKSDGATSIIMATARSSDVPSEHFREEVEAHRAKIVDGGFDVDKLIVEFALYDTRVEHDAEWIGAVQ